MKDKMLNDLCFAIDKLSAQENAAHTIHEIIYELKNSLDIVSAVLVEKNSHDDYLEIKNRYNVSEQFTRSYKRGIGTGVIGRIFYNDELAVVLKGENEDDYKDLMIEHDYEMAIVLRVSVEGRVLGFLALYFSNKVVITEQLRKFLISIVKLCSEAIRKEKLLGFVKEMRSVDPQTGLLYYHFFYQKLKEEFDKNRRMNIPMTVAIMDMDNFKRVMGVYGLDTAHELFKELADELRAFVRGIDMLGHYGTDEFIIYMPNTTLNDAELVLNRFLDNLIHKRFTPNNLCTSLSMGIASLHQDDSLEDLLSNTQRALYKSKLKGGKISRCDE
ncbi:diguanylate cyclase domain-containing protein [Candidatus Magnetominusculus dajiuhuensis]|uniref:sensor domain-containing diguanylate cyclase n=1 Tax=Candidatus Magnetominusculus dajiuhuensis TaxID=3137712 RepID=UPI003B42F338